jgi:hypothetical protein
MEIIKKKKVMDSWGNYVYLLGIDKEGKYVWLQEPSWDCGWYWGFGYIERYTNNKNPGNSRDIISHTHWDTEIMPNKYHTIYEMEDLFDAVTVTRNEACGLSELMKLFYSFQEVAEIYHSGSSGISKTIDLKNLQEYNRITKEVMPKIFKEIDYILNPDKEVLK